MIRTPRFTGPEQIEIELHEDHIIALAVNHNNDESENHITEFVANHTDDGSDNHTRWFTANAIELPEASSHRSSDIELPEASSNRSVNQSIESSNSLDKLRWNIYKQDRVLSLVIRKSIDDTNKDKQKQAALNIVIKAMVDSYNNTIHSIGEDNKPLSHQDKAYKFVITLATKLKLALKPEEKSQANEAFHAMRRFYNGVEITDITTQGNVFQNPTCDDKVKSCLLMFFTVGLGQRCDLTTPNQYNKLTTINAMQSFTKLVTSEEIRASTISFL